MTRSVPFVAFWDPQNDFYSNKNAGRTRRFLEFCRAGGFDAKNSANPRRVAWWLKLADELQLTRFLEYSPWWATARRDFDLEPPAVIAAGLDDWNARCRSLDAQGWNPSHLFFDQESFARPVAKLPEWIATHWRLVEIAQNVWPNLQSCVFYECINPSGVPRQDEVRHPLYQVTCGSLYEPTHSLRNAAALGQVQGVAFDRGSGGGPRWTSTPVGVYFSLGCGWRYDAGVRSWSSVDADFLPQEREDLRQNCLATCRLLATQSLAWVHLYPEPWGRCKDFSRYWQTFAWNVLGERWPNFP